MSPIPVTNREDPNPPERNEMDSVDSPQFIIDAGSESSDEDDNDENLNNGGYEMLPQEPANVSSDEEVDDNIEGAVGVSEFDDDYTEVGHDYKVSAHLNGIN